MRPSAWLSEYGPKLGIYTLHYIREYTSRRQCQGLRPVFLRFSGWVARVSCGFVGGLIVLCGFDDQSARCRLAGWLRPPAAIGRLADIAGGLGGLYCHIPAP